jgi:hypothetical protein
VALPLAIKDWVRLDLVSGGFIEAVFNEHTGTTAFALIRERRRIYGTDNTGGWHVHPFDDPSLHRPLRSALSFAEFVAAVERHEAEQ